MLPPRSLHSAFLVFGSLALALSARAQAPSRGEALYAEKCAMCHHVNGTGNAPVYPPLARSDWVSGDRTRLIRVLCEGLSGPIKVSGVDFAGSMPAQVLDDAAVAAVLSYIGSAWGNQVNAFTAEEVGRARARSRFPTFAALEAASAYAPLPAAPQGWKVREIAQVPEMSIRLARRRGGKDVFLLAQKGNIYRLNPASGDLAPIIKASDYLNPERGSLDALGLTQDAAGHLWIVTNQRLANAPDFVTNEIVIYRTSAMIDGAPAAPKPWFTTTYPFGIGPYNHGVSNLAFGPDGMLYVSSGSRTDGGEAGTNPRFFSGGEVDLTAAMWRLDPKAATPRVEVIARGIRNAFGFAWDDRGNLFSVSNGPDANSPEEMDVIVPGKHYGFPYQFSDWPLDRKAYPHTPAPPAGLEFTPAVRNLGPAAGGSASAPLATFDAHSSPAGMIWCGSEYPAPLGGSFLVSRFGNLLGAPHSPEDVGFDVLSCRPEKTADGKWQIRTTTILAPLGRPIDIVPLEGGKALILEYTRPTSFKSQLGWLPGRIIELAPETK